MTGEHVLAIDQLRSTVAALEGEREREAAVATFFAELNPSSFFWRIRRCPPLSGC